MHKPDEIATKLLRVPFETLAERTKNVARHVAGRKHIARNIAKVFVDTRASRGQHAADAVASFGGSWVFVGLFGATLLVWVVLNAVLVASRGSTFDPYPYILL